MSLNFPISLVGKRFAAGGITDPTDIVGLALWLDASDSATLEDAVGGGPTPLDDGDVAEWQDKSGNDNHCSQATAANRPHRRVAEVNGLDAIDFTQASKHILNSAVIGISSELPVQTAAKTAFVVAQYDLGTSLTGGGYGAFCLYDTAAGAGEAGAITGEVGYRCSARTFVSDQPAAIGSPSIITMAQSGAGNIETVVSMWLDGAVVTNDTGANGLLVASRSVYHVGGSEDLGAFMFDGKVCEIIVYDSELSASDRGDVETYLANKWGVTI